MSMDIMDERFGDIDVTGEMSFAGYGDAVIDDDTYARAYCIIAGIDWDDVAGWRWDGDRIEISLKQTATQTAPSN